MKVQRQNLSEEYSTTAGWVRDFSKGLHKNADYLNNLKSILNKRKDFDTIEEKMADLKSRVGFGLVKSVDPKDESNIREAGCGCNSCDSCSVDTEVSRLAEHAKSVFNYIVDLVKDRPDMTYEACIAHCREHPKLGFDRVEKRLNKKFEDAVRGVIGKHKKDPEAVEYISEADMAPTHQDDVAEYYSRANG